MHARDIISTRTCEETSARHWSAASTNATPALRLVLPAPMPAWLRKWSSSSGSASGSISTARTCAPATGALASRRTGSNEQVLREMLQLCAAACKLCGEECRRHAGQHEHCRICAGACGRCEQACQEAMRDVG
jgi:hypothetical protein